MSLHLGDRDPCGGALGIIVQHHWYAAGLRGSERCGLLVHRRQRA
jgi:hypothetical protein